MWIHKPVLCFPFYWKHNQPTKSRHVFFTHFGSWENFGASQSKNGSLLQGGWGLLPQHFAQEAKCGYLDGVEVSNEAGGPSKGEDVLNQTWGSSQWLASPLLISHKDGHEWKGKKPILRGFWEQFLLLVKDFFQHDQGRHGWVIAQHSAKLADGIGGSVSPLWIHIPATWHLRNKEGLSKTTGGYEFAFFLHSGKKSCTISMKC